MDRYAFLLIAMSMEDARAKLGFPPGSNPTDNEVNRAFRDLIREDPTLHVDRGGDVEKFQELEVAKAILLGQARPTYDRREPGEPESTGVERVRWEPPKKKEVTFQEAESKAGIPGGVAWLFVTPRQRGKSWSSDESSLSDATFVAYGRTDNKHVFVGANHYTKQDHFVGGTDNSDIWKIKSVEISIKADEGKNPAWLYGQVVKSLKGIGFDGRFNSKVIDAQGWSLDSKTPNGAEVSIKHWLVGSGQVAGDDAAVAGRKQVVELYIERSMTEKSGFYPKPRSRHDTGAYYGDYYRLSLILNGKPETLSEKDWLAFAAARFGGKTALEAVYGDYYYGGEKKQLTRLRQGKVIMQWMLDSLKDLSPDASTVLQAASGQMKG